MAFEMTKSEQEARASKGKGKKRGPGEFFAIDRRTWAEVCNLGLYEAVGYLVLGQGTGADNRHTNWSTTALRRYTGIPWERAKPAIENLIQRGIIRNGEKHSRTKPRYELLSWGEVAHNIYERSVKEHEARISRMLEHERHYVNDLQRGRPPERMSKTIRELFDALCAKGVLSKKGYGSYTVVPGPSLPIDTEPDLIWLPNAIVTGTSKGEDSPVKRLRAAGDIWTLRLFVDLYHAHSLTANGGIDPKFLYQKYERKQVGEQKMFAVWGFKPPAHRRMLTWDGPFKAHRSRPTIPDGSSLVWESVDWLERNGLLSLVPHLWDNDATKTEAEVIHPYGIPRHGEQIEIEVGEAATEAALSMVPDFKWNAAYREGYYYFVPVLNTLPNIQLIGIGRLRYRPRTAKTSEWHAELNKRAPALIDQYRKLKEEAERIKSQETAWESSLHAMG